MAEKQLDVALVGLGRIGNYYFDLITNYFHNTVKLKYIFDPQADYSQHEDQGMTNCQSFDEIIESSCDVVLVCSPAKFHCQQVIALSKAGKHIFCEKPLGTNEKEIRQCISAIKKYKTILHVGFNRRFDPGVKKIRKKFTGKPADIIKITSRDPAPPSREYLLNSGGLFQDMTCHDFDMARYLLGEVKTVYAMAHCRYHPEIKSINDYDGATIHLEFTSGAMGMIENSRFCGFGYDQRIELQNSTRTAISDNALRHQVTESSHQGHRKSQNVDFFLERYHQAYLEQLRQFFNTVSTNGQSLITGHDALKAFLLGKAANVSVNENRVVDMSESIFSYSGEKTYA